MSFPFVLVFSYFTSRPFSFLQWVPWASTFSVKCFYSYFSSISISLVRHLYFRIFRQRHLYFYSDVLLFFFTVIFISHVTLLYFRILRQYHLYFSCGAFVLWHFPSRSSSFLPCSPRIFVFLTCRIFSSSVSSLYLCIFLHTLWGLPE